MSDGTIARFAVTFDRPGRPRSVTDRVDPSVRGARLLALAHKIQRNIHAGIYADLADAARRLGLTRARVTQIVNLTLLAPAIQEQILALPPVTTGRERITERALRRIVAEAEWAKQESIWISGWPT